jgi:hypothetical protein
MHIRGCGHGTGGNSSAFAETAMAITFLAFGLPAEAFFSARRALFHLLAMEEKKKGKRALFLVGLFQSFSNLPWPQSAHSDLKNVTKNFLCASTPPTAPYVAYLSSVSLPICPAQATPHISPSLASENAATKSAFGPHNISERHSFSL